MDGQHVLITGASRGIGAAAARAFARQGWRVSVNYRSSAAEASLLTQELEGLGGRGYAIGADVSNPEQARRLVEEAEEALGPLDALVLNAGVGHFGLLTHCTDARWRQVMGVNLDGVFFVLRAALPGMIARKAGSVVTVSSVWGVTGASCEGAYSAAKAGVIGLTKAAAKELAPSGIRVNCVAPGAIDTQMNRRLTHEERAALEAEIPLGRLGTPEETAEVIVFLCSSGASYLTGQVLQPNGGLVI